MRFDRKVSTIVLTVVLIGACHGLACSEHERNALLQLFSYFSIDFSSLTMNTTNCCGLYLDNCGDSEGNTAKICNRFWFEVGCNETEGRVTDLYLSFYENRQRRIADLYLNASLFLSFKGLRSLSLVGLGIVGSAENEGFQRLSKLENLESLRLNDNFLNVSVLTFQGLCELRHLRDLSLSNNDFSGSVPSCLANMTSLQSLDLSFNQISGYIGSSPIRSLTSLRFLNLRENRFKVPISLAPFFNHSKLTYLDVQENELYAQTEVINLSPKFQLQTLVLSSHQSVGIAAYPMFLYHQRSLQSVDLSHIQIMGEFPYWLLENNTDLYILVLSNNCLSGQLQLPIHPHMSLSNLDISRNSIRGHIPSEFGAHFPQLEILNLSTNAFTGSIPMSFGMLSWLVTLDLSNNRLSGGIAEGLFMGMTMLEVFILSANQINGSIPDSMSHLSNLFLLDISHNNLFGSIPGWIGSFSFLDVLDLSENNLFGALPTNFCPPRMTQVKLSNNKLFGSLTKVFCDCSSLTTLDLGHNRFTGNIPEWIGRCSQLKFLLLSHNYLQGKIPIELCALDQLNLIDLSNNNLKGHILPCLMSHRNFDILKENDSNSTGAPIPAASAPDTLPTIAPAAFAPTFLMSYSLSPAPTVSPGALPPEGQRPLEFTAKSLSQNYQASILKYMSGIDLSCNNLTGAIPPEIGNLSHIQVLNLSHNSLTGPIPLMFENLKLIESLDLSYNKLYGKIPSQLTELNFLAVFSVAHNNLSGRTPEWVGQFATFNESSYEGNPLLCGMPLPKSCNEREPPSLSTPRTSTEEESEEDNGFIDMDAFYVSFLISYIMVLLVIAAVLYINPYWRRLLFAFIEASISNFYYFMLDNLPLLSKFGLS